MNELSWMIYLAEVALGLKATSFGLTIACLVGAFFSAMAADIGGGEWRFVHRFLLGGALALVFAVLIPSSQTVYAIAASEIGEDALRSETGGKAMRALNAWLDRQIEGSEEAGNDE